jgi:hypothetical protein
VKVETTSIEPAFKPVCVTLTFNTAEELNAFTDFLIASGPATVRRTLEKKSLRRFPKMPDENAREAVIAPITRTLKKLTVKPGTVAR